MTQDKDWHQQNSAGLELVRFSGLAELQFGLVYKAFVTLRFSVNNPNQDSIFHGVSIQICDKIAGFGDGGDPFIKDEIKRHSGIFFKRQK